jgi:hypothetical protein
MLLLIQAEGVLSCPVGLVSPASTDTSISPAANLTTPTARKVSSLVQKQSTIPTSRRSLAMVPKLGKYDTALPET